MRKVVLAVLILLSIFAVGPAPADAHSQRYNAHSGNDTGTSTRHEWWSTNGCTSVPDSVRGVFYFNHPCDHHDGCYGNHWQSRLGCDNTFWSNMNSACNYNWAWWNPARAACRTVRDSYYAGVRALGYPAYNGWSISGPSGW